MHCIAMSSGRFGMSSGCCGGQEEVAIGGGLSEVGVVTEEVWSVIGVQVISDAFSYSAPHVDRMFM